jgi:RimJ/RimL family protein N-acetyltransferase
MPTAINYRAASSNSDLQAIMRLQKINLPAKITAEELKAQGFVTVDHDMDTLRDMNTPYGHSTAWYGDTLAGYALVMETRFRDRIPILFPMFELLDGIICKGKPLQDWAYFVMGQVCVAKAYRGSGVFAGLYLDMKERLSGHFDFIVTEISTRNPRSIRAHEKVGFQNIHEYIDPLGEHWVVVALTIL